MFRPPISNPALKRTIRPIYAQHQATTYGGFLDPNWARSFDIYPGTVMCRLSKEIFTPYTASGNQKPFGLSALFLAPGFDSTANWTATNVTDGGFALLTGTAQGLLTPTGANNANAIAELIDVPDTGKILVRLNRYNFASSVAVGAA